MSVMSKRILVNLPAKLYDNLKKLAKEEYKSISAIIRESVMERMSERFSDEEKSLIEKGRQQARDGKGIDWRKIRRA